MQTFNSDAAPARCASTAPRTNAAMRVLCGALFEGEYIEVPTFRYRLHRRVVGHLSTPYRARTAPTRPHGDILLTVDHVSGGHADNAGTELRAGPQDFARLGVEG